MKELTKYSRVAAYLEKLYDKINADIFGGTLTRPVITIQSSTKAWGHLTVHDAWSIKGEGYKELNISTASLMRPIEATIATLIHEMCHQYDLVVLGIMDCSNKGLYHNRTFKQTAEAHGLICTCEAKHRGWGHTEPSDALIEWIIENDIREIPMARYDFLTAYVPGGSRTANGGEVPTATPTKSNSRRWVCPCCGTIVRSTKTVRIICADCMELMEERTAG